MHMQIETVKVVIDNEDGYKVINKSDMTDGDKLYKAEKTQTAEVQEKAEPAEKPLKKSGKK